LIIHACFYLGYYLFSARFFQLDFFQLDFFQLDLFS
jgi:hypothetical protein